MKNNRNPLRGNKIDIWSHRGWRSYKHILRALNAADTAQEVCGHPLSAVVCGLCGTCYCSICEDEARSGRKAK